MDKLLPFLCRVLPANTEALADMALDLRWTWNHGGDKLLEMLDPEAWQLTRNPWWILQSISQERIEKPAGSAEFQEELKRLMAVCQDYVQRSGWFKEKEFDKSLGIIEESRGNHFDPEVTDAFLAIEEEIVSIKEKYQDET
ncbi:MAG: DUF3417 domain-containing protein [Chloroflexi bacterium]|nr:DUF3417 domain-containing protein [Chloroflexota bacterium]